MKYKKKKLKNGLRVVYVPISESITTSFTVFAGVGEHFETKDTNGLSHFLEHMHFKGTLKRPTQKDIRIDLDGIGADNNALTGEDYTAYYAKAHPKHLRKIIDVISDIYLNSRLPEEEIDKERGVILGEIDMYRDDPRGLYLFDLWRKKTYGSDQAAGRSILGPKENIKRFKRDDFVSFKDKYYYPENTVILVVGKFKVAEVHKIIEDKFSNYKSKGKHPKVKTKFKPMANPLVFEMRPIDQTHILLGFQTFGTNSKEKHVLTLLNTILGQSMSSRLFLKIREEMGLGYYAYSVPSYFRDYGFLTIHTGVHNNRRVDAFEAIREETKKLQDELVSEDELKRAKNLFTGLYTMSFETTDALSLRYGHQEIVAGSISSPSETIMKIKSVNAKDIQKMARKIFNFRKATGAMVGPKGGEGKIQKILKK